MRLSRPRTLDTPFARRKGLDKIDIMSISGWDVHKEVRKNSGSPDETFNPWRGLMYAASEWDKNLQEK